MARKGGCVRGIAMKDKPLPPAKYYKARVPKINKQQPKKNKIKSSGHVLRLVLAFNPAENILIAALVLNQCL